MDDKKKRQQAWTEAYKSKAYWRPSVYLPNALEPEIRAFCDAEGLSVNELINAAVVAYMYAREPWNAEGGDSNV